jgi:arylformamidase
VRRKFWDISQPLRNGMPLWPGSSGMSLQRVKDLNCGDMVNEHDLALNLHTGTHIDAPCHFLADGACVDELPLDALVGTATVVSLPGTRSITATDLERAAIRTSAKRLLFQTDNSQRRQDAAFDPGYVAISADGAEWLAGRGVSLVGVDYLSVEGFGCDGEVHRILLGQGIVVVEGLNLADVPAGEYWLSCLPLRLSAEASPVRAVLMDLEGVVA